MLHQHHNHSYYCDHSNVRYCSYCDKTYCTNCNREWGTNSTSWTTWNSGLGGLTMGTLNASGHTHS